MKYAGRCFYLGLAEILFVRFPETNIAPENGLLEYYILLGWPVFRGCVRVSGSVTSEFAFVP